MTESTESTDASEDFPIVMPQTRDVLMDQFFSFRELLSTDMGVLSNHELFKLKSAIYESMELLLQTLSSLKEIADKSIDLQIDCTTVEPVCSAA